MRKRASGFGLIELMVAILLGLIILLGVLQIFISAKNTYLAQNASAAMQEDARYALSKMVQEIRMVGMFGYVTPSPDSTATDFTLASQTPISYVTTTVGTVTTGVLTLLTADVGANGGTPTWTILTDPVNYLATVSAGAKSATGMFAMPIRRVIYTYDSTNQRLLTTVAGTQSVLVSNVTAMGVLFGIGETGTTSISSYTTTPGTSITDLAKIRSVRITLTLSDPNGRVAPQTFNVVAAIRNRLP
ncbi:PilW family protein [Pseudomonas sp. RIT-To-2]|uniref:PilW family protein n=1 Tax=Pseudomonas sp. RIT-To-2 TaxID=3462541 RepID=UPI0024138B3B